MSHLKSIGVDVGVIAKGLNYKVSLANTRIDDLGDFEDGTYSPASLENWGCGCYDISTIGKALDLLAQFRAETINTLGEFSHGRMQQNRVTWSNMTEINKGGELIKNYRFENPSWRIAPSSHPQQITADAEGRYVMILPNADLLGIPAFGLVENQVYEIIGLNVGANRVTIQGNISVNLSEAGGARARGEDWEFAALVPSQWEWVMGESDKQLLEQGTLKGNNGAVSIQQNFDSSLPIGTNIKINIERANIGGSVRIEPIKRNGNYGTNVLVVNDGDGVVNYTVENEDMYGVKLSTTHGNNEVGSISMELGVSAGGAVQVYSDGSIEKISGGDAFNAGAISNQFINANQNGYAQFQYADDSKSLKVGLVYDDEDFSSAQPYEMKFIGGTNRVSIDDNIIDNIAYSGDWFRIRHYGEDNRVEFQKRQVVYESNTDYVFPTEPNSSGNDYHYDTNERPYIKALTDWNQIVEDQIYTINQLNTSNGNVAAYDLDGNFRGHLNQRGIKWEVVEPQGEDYVTFYTHSNYSSGANLYLDTSFYHTNGKINDVSIVSA